MVGSVPKEGHVYVIYTSRLPFRRQCQEELEPHGPSLLFSCPESERGDKGQELLCSSYLKSFLVSTNLVVCNINPKHGQQKQLPNKTDEYPLPSSSSSSMSFLVILINSYLPNSQVFWEIKMHF